MSISSGCYAVLRHHCEVTQLLLLLVLKVGHTPLISFLLSVILLHIKLAEGITEGCITLQEALD